MAGTVYSFELLDAAQSLSKPRQGTNGSMRGWESQAGSGGGHTTGRMEQNVRRRNSGIGLVENRVHLALDSQVET